MNPRGSTVALHLLFWFALVLVGIVNGVLREYTYGKSMSSRAAHQVSTLTAMVLSGAAVAILWRYRPLETAGHAWLVGCAWFFVTIVFEFVFGHYVIGHPWKRLFEDYDLRHGRVWGLFLLWILVLPFLFFIL